MERKKRLPPALPDRLEPAERPEELVDMAKAMEEPVAGWHFTGMDLSGEDLREMRFQKCVFQSCRFTGCDLSGASFEDVVLRHCDLSGIKADRTYFCRCRLTDVKAAAANFIDCRLVHLELAESSLRGANLTGASIEQAHFAAVDLSDAWFSECRHKGLVLEECTLIRTSFFKTMLKGLDFTTSRMEGITVSNSGEELRGAIVNVQQAAELARVLGVVIR